MKARPWWSVVLGIACGVAARVVPVPDAPRESVRYTRSHIEIAELPLHSQIEFADAIIRGTVVGVEARPAGPDSVTTDVTLIVREWLKGEGGPVQVVSVAGGVYRNIVHRVDAAPRFRDGEEVVLFLCSDRESNLTGILGLNRGVVRSTPVRDPAVDADREHAREEDPAFEIVRTAVNAARTAKGGVR